MNNPYAPPAAPVRDAEQPVPEDFTYGGFWLRFLAMLIDTVLIMFITTPLLIWIYGPMYFFDESRGLLPSGLEFLISYVLPAIATVIFWHARQATPGKMLLSLKIVDAKTLGPMGLGQAIWRYFAYIPAMVVLFLGFLWIAWDSRKQGWHDKLARTVVVRFYR